MKISDLFTLALVLFLNSISFGQVSSKAHWNEFELKYGPSLELWNNETNTPHRVVVSGINLSGGQKVSLENVEQLALNFLNENQSILKIPSESLIKSSLVRARDMFFLNYVQHRDGIPILNSEIIFRIHENGNLTAFGFDYFNNISIAWPFPFITLNEVKKIASSKLEIEGKKDAQIDIELAPYYYPIKKGKAFELRPVVFGTARHLPQYQERFYLDLLSKEFYQKENTLCQAVSGDVDGSILPILATDIPQNRAFQHMNVFVNGSAVVTDSLGNFNHSFSGTGTVNLVARLKGPFVNVKRFGGGDAQITRTVSNGQNVALHFADSNSTMGERNVFYHTNIAHDYIRRVDTGFTLIDQAIPCTVEDNSASCNAFWTGTQIFYNTGTGGCINSAHSASTIYHEYGHALNDILYQQAGKPQGMQSLTLHEAQADVTSCMMLDENRFALGFFGVGQFTRNLQNSNFYPQSVIGQQHTDGLILGGSFWDLRVKTDPETAYRLAHFAKYGTPDDPDLGIAFAEYFIETLIADDDDGNLGNGSPHFNEILSAFCGHGIGLNLFMASELEHNEVANQSTANLPVHVMVSYSVPQSFVTSLQNLEVQYSTNNFSSTSSVPLNPLTNGLDAFIPQQPEGTVVKYYFAFSDTSCQSQGFSPYANFQQFNYSYWVGDYHPVFSDDFETNKGWSVASTAASGSWQRADPEQVFDDAGKLVQPEDDHSPNGTICFVTGAQQGGAWFANDVDNGNTILTSPVLSGEATNQTIFQFYLWFVHGAGSVLPANGSIRVQLTNDGVSWADAEMLSESTKRDWRKLLFKVDEFKTPNDSLQFRIVVNDPPPGTIVEALIDDFQILELNQVVGLGENIIPASVQVYPNPAKEIVSFSFTERQDGEIQIFNLAGQKVWEKSFIQMESIKWNIGTKPSRNHAAGLYIYHIQLEDKLIDGKLIIKP